MFPKAILKFFILNKDIVDATSGSDVAIPKNIAHARPFPKLSLFEISSVIYVIIILKIINKINLMN